MTLAESLSGTTWELVSFQSEDKKGNMIYPMGEDATGFIYIHPGNRLSVHIMVADREKSRKRVGEVDFNTEAEKEMAELGYHAYTGPFTLNEDTVTLTTHVEVSLITSYIGVDQTRTVKLEGDTMQLSNVKHPERKLVWKKVEN